jgi:hypothetical protein
MFIQVISGTVTDRDAMARLDERWLDELRPDAVGFLGFTKGITDDDRFVVLARYASPEAARRNSDRPEQAAWWADMSGVVRDVTFNNCSYVQTLFGGAKQEAEFVQVMRGRVKHRPKATALLARAADAEALLGQIRPDVIGEVIALHDEDDGFTDVVYFTTEQEARANEVRDVADDAQQMQQEFESILEVDEYLDLRDLSLR